MTFTKLKQAVKEGATLAWNDPEPIEGNDYTISYLEDISDEDFDELSPILIQYNNGASEAQVFLHEIVII